MAKFFIDRPVFAWVIAIFIVLAGWLAIRTLPVAQYPSITPPMILVRATLPGASAQTVAESVTSVLEQELNGVEGLLYIESNSEATGSSEIILVFSSGTDPDFAAVNVQNRIKRAEPRLPKSVLDQGIMVLKTTRDTLMFVSLASVDGKLDALALADYMTRYVLNELKRLPGVGEARLFGSETAMRIWVDPNKLAAKRLAASDIAAAVRSQNAQVAAGKLGDEPSLPGQRLTSAVAVRGQLSSAAEFGDIILRANTDGSSVRLRDVARIEIGAQAYDFRTRLDGSFNALVAIQMAPNANALLVARAVRQRMNELAPTFPAGVRHDIPYDTSLFVKISIDEVIKTLLEAALLVFVVMFLFLQNLRYTLIPALVVPIALMGGFLTLLLFGYSINVLTLFGMVLAIGILVDDAIVVVENVERIMREEGLGPRDATRKAMEQITGAIIGITLVLVAVFIPMAFFDGAVGAIYRQFSVTMAATMVFSAVLALTLTPALCATLLKPVPHPGHGHDGRGLFGLFNRGLDRFTDRYRGWVATLLDRTGLSMLVYAVIVLACGLLYAQLPVAFLPSEDKGFILTNIELPPAASMQRTMEVIAEVERHYQQESAVSRIVSIAGYSFSGNGLNAGLIFSPLKDWSARAANNSAGAIAARANAHFSSLKEAQVFAVNPPPLPGLGNTSGFSFRLQDRGGLGQDAMIAARDQLVALAAASSKLRGVRPEDLEDTPQLDLEIDRDKANALGVSFENFNLTVSTLLGSSYLGDFPNHGRQDRVIMQADAGFRVTPGDIGRLQARTERGAMVPLESFSSASWGSGPVQRVRYNGYPAVRISGEAAPGYSTGDALLEMENLMRQLPQGFSHEWSGQSREERESASQAPALFALSLLAVFLVLAALYESTSIPAAVMLVVPLGIIGALAGALLRELPNDVYFKVGLITIIGLSAKNAILIIEFAKDAQARGTALLDAPLQAVTLRLRPILMTSLAFILGVLPLVLARGAGSASQRAIGTGVMGGMITATVLAVLLVPVFFVVVRRLSGRGG